MIPIVFRTIPAHARAPRCASCRSRSPSLSLGGCATFDRYAPSWRSLGVYKIDINQGNYLSQDMVDKLKVGHDAAAGAGSCSARRSSRRRFAPTAGTTYTSSRARDRSSSIATSPSTSPTARSRAGKATRCPSRSSSSTARASAKALPSDAPGDKSFWDRMLDVFRK